jgi:uncharacterized protein (TIGR00661 family)
LRQYGEVDFFLSGNNSHLEAALPVKYRSKGVCLHYNNRGGLHYLNTARACQPLRVLRELKELPLEEYDVIINDFECITSLACALKGLRSTNMGHQASFQSIYTPRPDKKDPLGEFILKYYGRATNYIGLNFERYDDFIYQPVIKKEVLMARPRNNGHITVYLSAYNDATIARFLQKIPNTRFEVFSKEVKSPTTHGAITFMPVSNKAFTTSMINSEGVITGAGFETPAEALHLQKKLMVIPIRGQYEQVCNGAALERMGVKLLEKIEDGFESVFHEWMQTTQQAETAYGDIAPSLIRRLFEQYPAGRKFDRPYPELIFN